MINQNTYKLDLLRQRREESNDKKVTINQIKKLRKKGFVVGAIITSIGIAVCSLTGVHTYQRIKYKQKLDHEASQYQLLKTKYQSLIKNVESIYKINNQISEGIIGTKSGSALLLELSKVLPTTIQLKGIYVRGRQLEMNGIANQPYALEAINSLIIQISNSFLIKDQSVFLSRAKSSINRDIDTMNFNLTSEFSNPSSQELIANYEELGSYGLLKRVNLLKMERLIK
mgnify:CR=1 FL=1|tara:strand:+ start:197 stop:880 length:684 start_codon:yes stop_codon:yes gene_type:complete